MSKSAILAVKDGKIRGTINDFLKDLLRRKVVEAVLVLLTHKSGNTVSPGLVTDPSFLDRADALAPLLPVNSARIVSAMTRLAPMTRKTAVVMRSCELRSLVELVKLKQASLENLVLIGVDCFGTYPAKDYEHVSSDDFVRARLPGNDDPKLRMACQICEYPVPLTADLTIGLMGADLDKGIFLQANSPQGEEILKEYNDEPAGQREKAVSGLVSRQKQKRQEFFEQSGKEVSGLEKLSAIFATCTNCHNCKTACPVCYCKECFFDSATFDLEGDRYLGMAERKGALRMPADTLLFHLTRMTHMAVSCVGCGSCEEACPNGIPLLKIFQMVSNRVQKLFDYVPGRNLEDELPLATFKEDELGGIGAK